MVGVAADIVEVVVLAAGADALLAVGRAGEAGEGAAGVGGAREDGLELVHSRVGEEEGRVVVRHHGRRLEEGVALLGDKEAHKLVADA